MPDRLMNWLRGLHVPVPGWRYLIEHLVRFLLTMGLLVIAITLLGLALTSWSDSLWTHTLFAVIAVLPILMALTSVALLASRFLRDLYNIKSLPEAFAFLSRLFFMPIKFAPYLLIKEGRIALGEGSGLHKIGGPGYLVVYHDSAVVTEQFGKLKRVITSGFPRLERFERVWEIVDLRPQRWPFKVNGMSREGIPVSCIADITFRIDDRVQVADGEFQPKQVSDENKEPYPFTEAAVFRAATSRWVRPPDWTGRPQDWAGRVVIGFTEGILRNILAEYRLDWLLAPAPSETEHPREVIRRRLEEQLHNRVSRVGARIVSVKLGDIEVDEQIPLQWLEAWQADWEGQALATRAEGEAELLRMEVAQAQAQAEMIIALNRALQSAVTKKDDLQPYLLASRFVQALNWISYDPYSQTRLPPEAMRTLKQLQHTLGAEQMLPPAPAKGK